MLKNLLLLLASSILSFVALEIVLRITMPERLAFVPVMENNSLTYVPNQTQRSRHIEWDYTIDINSDGFRNDKNLVEINNSTILSLGDSFAEGYGVALDETYSKQLEKILRNSEETVHVFNAGHSGTNPAYYRLIYNELFRRNTNIERVIIGFFVGNDLFTSTTQLDGHLRVGNEYGEGWRYKLKVFLGSHVALYAVANHVLKANARLNKWCKKLGACDDPPLLAVYSTAFIDKTVPRTIEYLAQLAQQVTSDGREAIVLIIPTREQVDDELWAGLVSRYGDEISNNRLTVNNRLVEGLENAKVDVIDFTPTAIAHSRNKPDKLYFRYDGHWTALGHELAAKQLARFIETQDP